MNDLILRLFSWWLNRYRPHHIVYGETFLDGILCEEGEDRAVSGALVLAADAASALRPGWKRTAEFTSIQHKERGNIGSYRVTVERLEDEAKVLDKGARG
jgi:hypothetical protein